MVKKRSAPKKSAPKKIILTARGDQSRLDLKPLQRHIRKRIKDLESGRPQKPAAAARGGAAARGAESTEDTIARLMNALETLEDICHPTMAIPI